MLSQWQCLPEEASEAPRRQGPRANDWGLRFDPTKWETFLTISTSPRSCGKISTDKEVPFTCARLFPMQKLRLKNVACRHQ